MSWPTKPVSSPTLGQQQAGRTWLQTEANLSQPVKVSTLGQGLPWQKKK